MGGHDVDVEVGLPEVRVQRGHVVDEPAVLVEGDRVVGHRDQSVSDVAHEQHGHALVGHPDDRLVDAVGQAGEDAATPELQDRAALDAGGTHRPVGLGVEVLHDVPLAVDDDAVEPGAGLARRLDRRHLRRAGQRLTHRPCRGLAHPRHCGVPARPQRRTQAAVGLCTRAGPECAPCQQIRPRPGGIPQLSCARSGSDLGSTARRHNVAVSTLCSGGIGPTFLLGAAHERRSILRIPEDHPPDRQHRSGDATAGPDAHFPTSRSAPHVRTDPVHRAGRRGRARASPGADGTGR